MFRKLQSDLRRYALPWYRLWLLPQVWVTVWYRFGHWLYKENTFKLFFVLKPLYLIAYTFIETFLQMRVDPSAEIGEGFFICHSGGVRLHPDVIIGEIVTSPIM